MFWETLDQVITGLVLVLQTFVNDVRIQEQMYITLKLEDKLRFGYDILSLSASQMLHFHRPGMLMVTVQRLVVIFSAAENTRLM